MPIKNNIKTPVVLLILDGWGVAPDSPGNAISRAKTPNMDRYITTYPSMTLRASSEEVGLSWGEMGNSEVGHLSLGSGIVFYQNLPRLNKEIKEGTFFENETLLRAAEHVRKNKSKFHILGIASSGGVHGHIEHIYAMLEFCKQQKIKEPYLHLIMDGRDAIYNSGKGFVKELLGKVKELRLKAHIATIGGRFYAMDRDNNWDRIQKYFDAMVKGESEERFSDPIEAIEHSYANEVYDEEMVPVVISEKNNPEGLVEDGDSIVFTNFRADRARQITKAFTLPDFNKFDRGHDFRDLFFVNLMEVEKDLPVEIAYLPISIKSPLSKVISDTGLRQIHIAETEKYAHVTFFFNGGREEPFDHEDREVIPSPSVASYDKKPEMSAAKITEKVLKYIRSDKYQFFVVNYANADMVGHTGNLKATIKAIEFLDKQIGKIVDEVLARDGVIAITADHGNAEELQNLQTGNIDKEHSTNPVPFVIIGTEWEGKNVGLPETLGPDLSLVPPVGTLSDVAPTLLNILNIKKPDEMTGIPLL